MDGGGQRRRYHVSSSSDGVMPVAGIILKTTSSGGKILPGKSKTFRLHFKVTSVLAMETYFPYISVSLKAAYRPQPSGQHNLRLGKEAARGSTRGGEYQILADCYFRRWLPLT